jgi:hypothetical protein
MFTAVVERIYMSFSNHWQNFCTSQLSVTFSHCVNFSKHWQNCFVDPQHEVQFPQYTISVTIFPVTAKIVQGSFLK